MNQEQGPDRSFSALAFALQLGYLIAIPITAFAIGGRLLDRWLGTSPWLLLGGILLSLVVSSVLVTKKAREVIEKPQADSRKPQG